ncbi:l-ascorbate oxidase-like protein [Hordeum vulgare]|nr:l-ascorbate oxidase-like protein [Hordeum vulgare]
MSDPSPATLALSLSGHTEGTALEFVVGLCGPTCGRLCLPRPFAKVMEVDKPQGVCLHAHGCSNGAIYNSADYAAPRVMLSRHGWKNFGRANNFMAGHVLRFKLVEAYMLSIKIYGHSGACLGCCEESKSNAKSSSSSDSDEEDTADEDGDRNYDSESPAVKSDYNNSGSS